jgi:hypothetical protein
MGSVLLTRVIIQEEKKSNERHEEQIRHKSLPFPLGAASGEAMLIPPRIYRSWRAPVPPAHEESELILNVSSFRRCGNT